MTFLQTATGRGQMVLHARVGENAGEVCSGSGKRRRRRSDDADVRRAHVERRDGRGARRAALGRAALELFLAGSRCCSPASGFTGCSRLRSCSGRASWAFAWRSGPSAATSCGWSLREAWLLVAIGIAVGVPAAIAVGRARLEPDFGPPLPAGSNRPAHHRRGHVRTRHRGHVRGVLARAPRLSRRSDGGPSSGMNQNSFLMRSRRACISLTRSGCSWARFRVSPGSRERS